MTDQASSSAGSILTVVLAAGMGTRMKSDQPKVMHQIGGRPMVGHVLDLCQRLGATDCAVVVGPGMDKVAGAAKDIFEEAGIFEQTERLGTAHAVLAARPAVESWTETHDADGIVLVLYGDTPLLTREALDGLVKALRDDADVGVLGFVADDPTGYGRLLVNDAGQLTAIREEKDASDEEREVRLCNSGVMGFKARHMLALLDKVGCDNAKGEYYLTDAIGLARGDGLQAVVTLCDEEDVLGVNDRTQLAEAEEIFQWRARQAAMLGGATLVAPETVFFSHDTKTGRDVVIEPNVVFGPGVTVGDGAVVHSFCHFEGATIQDNAVVGPFARLRPGASLGKGAKVGNFCEVKNADIAEGAKVNHLSYIGDAEIGEMVNIGAGTITCNYDGFFKHKTVIRAGSFVGSNSSLIAPVTIGEGAYIGSGSVISSNVPDDALAITRPDRRTINGWARKYRASQKRRKFAQSQG